MEKYGIEVSKYYGKNARTNMQRMMTCVRAVFDVIFMYICVVER